jgi:hypothetical protein
MSYDGLSYGNIKFYVNGTLVTSMQSYATGIAINSSALHIGASPCPGDEDFSGLMDEVRLYNRALSASEILVLYNMTPISTGTGTLVSGGWGEVSP